MASTKEERLPYNPAVLRWARERLGLAVEDAAEKVHVKPERVADWESGERAPTVNQGRDLADLYARPFLELFAKEVPSVPDVALVPDYRLHKDVPVGNEEASLRLFQSQAEEHRLNALALLQELGEPVPRLPDGLTFEVGDDPELASERARQQLAFPIQSQLALKVSERRLLPDIIRSKLEAHGVLVLKYSGLSAIRVRGICLYADPLPTVVFGSESPGAQAFTLAHEFGHVLLRASGISGQPGFVTTAKSGSAGVEEWCNKFAAGFLIPQMTLYKLVPKPAEADDTFDTSRLAELAQTFSISRHAMLIRLVSLGYVKSAFYWQTMRPVFIREENDYSGFGRAPYYGTRYVNSRGRFYTGLVLEAWETGRITGHNAAEYMGIKNLAHLRDIREHFGR